MAIGGCRPGREREQKNEHSAFTSPATHAFSRLPAAGRLRRPATYRTEDVKWMLSGRFVTTKDGRPLTGTLIDEIAGSRIFEIPPFTRYVPYKDGKPEGRSRSHYPSGALREEETYVNGLREDVVVWYYESGSVEAVMPYEHDERHGLERFYYPDGALKSETRYFNGKQYGVAKGYHNNGVLKYEAPYVAGRYTGIYKSYHENGALESEVAFLDGNKVGLEKMYYPSGELRQESFHTIRLPYDLTSGRQNGPEKEYHRSGRLKRTAFYKDGYKDGLEKEYYPSGRLKRQTSYVSWGPDRKHGPERLYDEKGRLTRETWYKNGDVVKDRILIPSKAADPNYNPESAEAPPAP